MKYISIKLIYQGIKGKILYLYAIPLLRRLGYKKDRTSKVLPASSFCDEDNGLVSLMGLHRNYLTTSGWLNSKNLCESKRQNEHIPWISFPMIFFLDKLNLDSVRLLEFGGGASTIYFAQKCRNVLCVEFDPVWLQKLENLFINNNNIKLINANNICTISNDCDIDSSLLLQAYALDTENSDLVELSIDTINFINFSYYEMGKADLVFIDGGYRNLELIIAAYACNNSLGIIVDNADFPDTKFGVEKLKELGYLEIPFHGLSPLNSYSATTSFFAKNPDKLLNLLL